MPCDMFTLGHVPQYKIIQTFELNVLDYYYYILNNQILGHMATHHLPSIMTKIVTS